MKTINKLGLILLLLLTFTISYYYISNMKDKNISNNEENIYQEIIGGGSGVQSSQLDKNYGEE